MQTLYIPPPLLTSVRHVGRLLRLPPPPPPVLAIPRLVVILYYGSLCTCAKANEASAAINLKWCALYIAPAQISSIVPRGITKRAKRNETCHGLLHEIYANMGLLHVTELLIIV